MSAEAPDPLPRSFYEPTAAEVAPRLLGHLLLRRTPGGDWAGGIVVETEAYLANDPACHGFRRETVRNRSMYGPPGHAYVYFIYGNYWCCNAVCAPERVAEAVLIRAIEPVFGLEWMQANRPVGKPSDVAPGTAGILPASGIALRHLTSGPAKLCMALEIDRKHDGLDLCDSNSALIIARNVDAKRFIHRHKPLITTTRIGISVAADLPLRFYLDGSKFVSKRRSA
jgi:DNA-3-methyladenine glycosylase